jgi:hypothetical protein
MSFENKITDLQKQILSVHGIVVPLDTLIRLINQSSQLSISNKHQLSHTKERYNTADINRAENIAYDIGHKNGHEDGCWNLYKLFEENNLIKTEQFNNLFKQPSPRHQINSIRQSSPRHQINSIRQSSPRHQINSRRLKLSSRHQINSRRRSSPRHQINSRRRSSQKNTYVEEFENEQNSRPPIYKGYIKKN